MPGRAKSFVSWRGNTIVYGLLGSRSCQATNQPDRAKYNIYRMNVTSRSFRSINAWENSRKKSNPSSPSTGS